MLSRCRYEAIVVLLVVGLEYFGGLMRSEWRTRFVALAFLLDEPGFSSSGDYMDTSR